MNGVDWFKLFILIVIVLVSIWFINIIFNGIANSPWGIRLAVCLGFAFVFYLVTEHAFQQKLKNQSWLGWGFMACISLGIIINQTIFFITTWTPSILFIVIFYGLIIWFLIHQIILYKRNRFQSQKNKKPL